MNAYERQDSTLHKTVAWYEVKELPDKMNKTHIGKLLGIHHDTVRSYIPMSLREYKKGYICNINHKNKYQQYYILKEFGFLFFFNFPSDS